MKKELAGFPIFDLSKCKREEKEFYVEAASYCTHCINVICTKEKGFKLPEYMSFSFLLVNQIGTKWYRLKCIVTSCIHVPPKRWTWMHLLCSEKEEY